MNLAAVLLTYGKQPLDTDCGVVYKYVSDS